MKKTVILAGGAGFIGSNIAEKYIDSGYRVVVVDNLSTGYMKNLNKISNNENFVFCKADIRNEDEMDKIFNEYRPNTVNNHAAQKSVAESVIDPLKDLDINLKGFLVLLKMVNKYKVENFIYVSSGGALSKEIIGNELSREYDEPQLMSPYAIDKYAGEKYLELYSKIYDFNYTILRYSNVYGPRQVPEGECGVIPIFVNNILSGKESTLMTYDDMPRGCTRDYINVEDVARVNLLALEKPLNTIFNIGSGIEIGILDIYEKVAEVFNSNLKVNIKGPRLGDVKRSVLNVEKVLENLGFSPKIDLETGLFKLKEYIENEEK